MKFILLQLLVFSVFVVYPQSDKINCSIENPNQFLQIITGTIVRKPSNLKLNLKDGIYPIECNSYVVIYNKNGKLKDSVLYENTKWNLDGTLSSRTWYDAEGEVSRTYRYTYEKKGNDSIITAYVEGYNGNSKYYINEKNVVFKFESYNDSNLNSIKQSHLYTYDESLNFVEASLNYPSSSSPEQIWKWQYDPINYVAQIFVNDRLHSIVNLNLDSCFVQDVGVVGGDPIKTLYYFDPNGNIIKEIHYFKFKQKIIAHIKYKEWNSANKLTREYGTDFIGKKIDITYIYHQNGLLIKEILNLEGNVINHHYVFKN